MEKRLRRPEERDEHCQNTLWDSHLRVVLIESTCRFQGFRRSAHGYGTGSCLRKTRLFHNLGHMVFIAIGYLVF